MIAFHPNANGDPDILDYATLSDVFQSPYFSSFPRNTGPADLNLSPDSFENPGGAAAAAKVLAGPPTGKAWLGVIHQAGPRAILVDKGGHTLYYGLHMNQAFADFVQQNGLQTSAGILAVGNSADQQQNLQFPAGVVEYKTAWMDIDPRDFPDPSGKLGTMQGVVPKSTNFDGDPGDFSNYITTMAWLPWLSMGTDGKVQEDPDHPILRKVALIAVHSVYTYPGHPEFVWGSIQHVNVTLPDPDVQAFAGVTVLGRPDTTPSTTGADGGASLPTSDDLQNKGVMASPDPVHDYLFFTHGTPENQSYPTLSDTGMDDSALQFDEPTQTFKTGGMNVYRVFPGSKANSLQPDTAVFSLNSNLNTLFKGAPASDKRQHYRLVAAVWMDKPALFGIGPKQKDGSFPGLTLQNDTTNPLVQAALMNDPVASVTEGVTCGTPQSIQGATPESGDVPGATGFNNTVPGCDTRYDELLLPDAGRPSPEPDGGPVNPGADFDNHSIGTDSPFSILGGEDRMSSTTMETFTQNNTFHNCFACHNTQPISSFGTVADPECVAQPDAGGCDPVVIPFAAKINVSHMFAEFIEQEEDAKARAAARTGN